MAKMCEFCGEAFDMFDDGVTVGKKLFCSSCFHQFREGYQSLFDACFNQQPEQVPALEEKLVNQIMDSSIRDKAKENAIATVKGTKGEVAAAQEAKKSRQAALRTEKADIERENSNVASFCMAMGVITIVIGVLGGLVLALMLGKNAKGNIDPQLFLLIFAASSFGSLLMGSIALCVSDAVARLIRVEKLLKKGR